MASSPVSRRLVMKGAAVTGAAAWVAPAVILATGSPAAAASGSPGFTGRFNLYEGFGTTNPSTAGPWAYYEPVGTAQALLLGPYTRTPPVRGWQGTYDTNPDASFPIILINETNAQIGLVPAMTVFGHPGQPGHELLVAFTNPGTGLVRVDLTVADIDGGGGDGVHYTITADALGTPTVILDGDVANGGTTGPLTATFAAVTGQQTLFTLGPRSTYDYDSTAISLTYTYL